MEERLSDLESNYAFKMIDLISMACLNNMTIKEMGGRLNEFDFETQERFKTKLREAIKLLTKILDLKRAEVLSNHAVDINEYKTLRTRGT